MISKNSSRSASTQFGRSHFGKLRANWDQCWMCLSSFFKESKAPRLFFLRDPTHFNQKNRDPTHFNQIWIIYLYGIISWLLFIIIYERNYHTYICIYIHSFPIVININHSFSNFEETLKHFIQIWTIFMYYIFIIIFIIIYLLLF